MNFNILFDSLHSIGLFDVVLPFFLVFGLIFALLSNIKIFASLSRRIAMIVAFVFGATFTVAYNYIAFLNDVVPKISVFLLFIFVLYLVLEFIKFDYRKYNNGYMALGLIFVVVVIWSYILGWLDGFYDLVLKYLSNGVLWGVIAIIGVFYYITYDREAAKEKKKKRGQRNETGDGGQGEEDEGVGSRNNGTSEQRGGYSNAGSVDSRKIKELGEDMEEGETRDL